MAVRTLRWPNGPRWTMSVQLDRRVFVISADYNTRMDTWVMSLQTGDGEELLNGVRIVKDWSLLPDWRDERFPQGQLFAVAPNNRVRNDPERSAFDGNEPEFRFVYMEPTNETI